MFVTSHGPEIIEPTRHMYDASHEALSRLGKVSPSSVSNYMELGRTVGYAGDHLLTVALWKPEGVEVAGPEALDMDTELLPKLLPIWAVSKVINNQRVTVGADFVNKTFAASLETFNHDTQGRPEVWQVHSVLGQIMARDAMDVTTFVTHTAGGQDSKYYPFSMFSKEMAENPQKVTSGFLFGLQEIAGAVLAASDRPSLKK